jgi:hypothetical protein
MALLTPEQQQAIKPLSQNNLARKFPQLEKEVEELEVRNLIGDAFLLDLQTSPAGTANAALLDGAEFENADGYTVKHQGLRYVMAYYIYARYVIESMVNDTYTGQIMKSRDDGQTLSTGLLKTMQQEARNMANREWSLILDFLNLKVDDYPYWKSNAKREGVFTPRFKGIRKTTR